MANWENFPLSDIRYFIKLPALGYLYADNAGFLRSNGDPEQQPEPETCLFKFTKNSDGTFSIYSAEKERFLKKDQILHFAANNSDRDDARFFLFLHQQIEHPPGILVDIRSLAHGSYLAKERNGNLIEATARRTPDNKFLISPALEDDEEY